MKLKTIVCAGNRDTRQLTLQNYHSTKDEFAEEGITIPTMEQLEFDSDAVWHVLLSKEYTIQLLCELNGKHMWYSYKFKRGFVWDLASIPKIARSIVDNDDPAIIDASMVHDSNFTCHFVGFRPANELFMDMFRMNGGNKVETFLAWLAVASPFGRLAYKKRTVKRAMWQQSFVDFSIARDYV
jgi:hypothetical protein